MPRNLRVPSARGNTPRDSNDCLIAQRSTWVESSLARAVPQSRLSGLLPPPPRWVRRSAPSQRAGVLVAVTVEIPASRRAAARHPDPYVAVAPRTTCCHAGRHGVRLSPHAPSARWFRADLGPITLWRRCGSRVSRNRRRGRIRDFISTAPAPIPAFAQTCLKRGTAVPDVDDLTSRPVKADGTSAPSAVASTVRTSVACCGTSASWAINVARSPPSHPHRRAAAKESSWKTEFRLAPRGFEVLRVRDRP